MTKPPSQPNPELTSELTPEPPAAPKTTHENTQPETAGSAALSANSRAAISAAMLSRIWQFLAGPITVILIAKFFSPQEQGFFYAFSGYLGMQTFFELGLSSILITVAGHEYAQAQQTLSPTLKEPLEASEPLAKLSDLFRKAVVFYTIAAIGFALISGGSGLLFFARQDAQVIWQGPWVTVVIFAAANLWLTPWMAILEATGDAALVHRGRFAQAILGSFAVWIALSLRLGLWTSVVAACMQTVVQIAILWGLRASQFRTIWAAHRHAITIAWRKTVLPLQWRIAVQGIALYLATQALTLVLLETQTAQVAGQWGMTWTILLALQAMATAWLTAAFPQATHLAARKQWSEFRSYWTRMGIASGACLLLGLIGFTATLAILDRWQWPLAKRFIPPWHILSFGVGMLAYHAAACLGYLVRAQRRESLYWAATLGQAIVAAGCWYACGVGGVRALCVAYATLNLLVVLPLHVLAWWIDRRENHTPNGPRYAA